MSVNLTNLIKENYLDKFDPGEPDKHKLTPEQTHQIRVGIFNATKGVARVFEKADPIDFDLEQELKGNKTQITNEIKVLKAYAQGENLQALNAQVRHLTAHNVVGIPHHILETAGIIRVVKS